MIKVLFVFPYNNIYPPGSGGMQRCFHLVVQAASHFDLTILTGQEPSSFKHANLVYPALENIGIIQSVSGDEPSGLFGFLPSRMRNALRFRWYRKSLFAGTDTLFLKYLFSLRRLLSGEKFDVILLSNLSLIGLIPMIRKMNPSAVIVYDAHNVDSSLAADLNARGLASYSLVRKLLSLESSLGKHVDAVTACSERDLSRLRELNGGILKGRVVPNAAVFQEINRSEEKRLNQPEKIMFCGSLDYDPNREGLSWFIRSIWPGIRAIFPELKMLVIGSGNPGVELETLLRQPGIEFEGFVKDISSGYESCLLAVVPLLTGSGTRLKILEAMGHKVPVISTSKGAEGIDYKNGTDIMIADDENTFVSKISMLLRDSRLRKDIADSAHILIKNRYNWNVSGKLLCDFLTELASERQLSEKNIKSCQ